MIKSLGSVFLMILSFALLAAPASASATNEYCGPVKAKTAVIVIHGGGFVIGDNSLTSDTCQAMAAKGFRVINLSYPLGDLIGAEQALYKATVEARKTSKKVYSYGESAGAGLAALAAARSWTDGAYAWAPVSDLVAWKKETEAAGFLDWRYFKDSSPTTLVRLSAVNWASKKSSPALVVHGRDDTIVSYQESVRLKKRWPKMRLATVKGGHTIYEPSFINATKNAINCFLGKSCSWAKG